MDRKEFIRHCGLGVCGCVICLPEIAEPLRANDSEAPDQRLAFARYQLSKMVAFMAAEASTEAASGILQKTGRECARIGKLHVNFKNEPEGYFAAAKKNWGTEFLLGQNQ